MIYEKITSFRYADLTGDGVKELIVVTTTGVQVHRFRVRRQAHTSKSEPHKMTIMTKGGHKDRTKQENKLKFL